MIDRLIERLSDSWLKDQFLVLQYFLTQKAMKEL